MANFKGSYLSLDDLAKGDTSPLYQSSGVAQLSARLKGADKDSNKVIDQSFLEKELSKGTVGLWAGLTEPERVSLMAVRPDGTAKLGSWANESDVMLDKIMPVVMPMIVSWGFGGGLANALGLQSGSLASAAVKAGTSQAVNKAQGGDFNFQNFLLSALLKTNFKSGG